MPALMAPGAKSDREDLSKLRLRCDGRHRWIGNEDVFLSNEPGSIEDSRESSVNMWFSSSNMAFSNVKHNTQNCMTRRTFVC